MLQIFLFLLHISGILENPINCSTVYVSLSTTVSSTEMKRGYEFLIFSNLLYQDELSSSESTANQISTSFTLQFMQWHFLMIIAL